MIHLHRIAVVLILSGVLMQPTKTETVDNRWLGKTARHEDFPLALRVRPYVVTPENQRNFPQLTAITLQLAKVRADGMPEPDYNDTLADLDAGLIDLFEINNVGLTVLVETFNGRRTFYSFTQATAPVQALVTDFQKRNPMHAISIQVKSDPNWGFITDYRKQFPW